MQEKFEILIDTREKNSLVASELVELGIDIEFRHLKVGDFLIRDVAIERKTVGDFINSMLNKRLIRQLEEIKQYPKQLLVIEGIEEQEIYDDSGYGVNGNAIRGFLLSILLEFGVPIIFSKDYKDTARFLSLIAKKQEKSHFSLRVRKKSLNKKEQLQYIVEGFPGIGPVTAKKLLKKFGNIKNIVSAKKDRLREILGKKADIFIDLVSKFY